MARQPILKCIAAINKQLPGNNPPHFPVLRPSELTDDAAKDRFAEDTRLFAIAQHARFLVNPLARMNVQPCERCQRLT
jgi:predicted component of type VI protein secretion system